MKGNLHWSPKGMNQRVQKRRMLTAMIWKLVFSRQLKISV